VDAHVPNWVWFLFLKDFSNLKSQEYVHQQLEQKNYSNGIIFQNVVYRHLVHCKLVELKSSFSCAHNCNQEEKKKHEYLGTLSDDE